MVEEIKDREIRKKRLMAAIDKPHLLIYEESYQLHSSNQNAETVVRCDYNLPQLHYALAKHSNEEELQAYIDYFTEALVRHRKIHAAK